MKNNTLDEFSLVQKGKISIAEALKELETVKKAFEVSERLESKINSQDAIINEIYSKVDLFVSYTHFTSKIEEVKSLIPKIIKDKFEEFSSQYFLQLNEKLNKNEVDSFVSNRCTWAAYNTLSQNVDSLKARIDKHIFSDFEGLRTKLKVQIGDKQNDFMNEVNRIKEEFSQFKLRVGVVEQKIQEMFVDDGLGDSEDYDSQEENDNIMQNLQGNKLESLESSDEESQNNMKIDLNKTQSLQITVSELKPTSESVKQPEPEIIQNPPSLEVNKNSIQPGPPKEEIKETIVRDTPTEAHVQETPSKEVPKVPNKEVPTPEISIKEVPVLETTIKEVPVPETTIKEVPVTEAPIKEVPVAEAPTKEVIKPVELLRVPSSKDQEPQSKLVSLEIPEKPNRKHTEEDRASSRHKKGSSIGDPVLSRKNSMTSSIGQANPGGLRTLNKKVTSLQKDIETYKISLDESKETFDQFKAELGNLLDKIYVVRERCEEIEDNRKGMEMSFIKALRRSGKDKKPQKQVVSSISSEEVKKIFLMLSEKSQKIAIVETNVEKMSLDLDFIKTSFKEKLNEIISSIRLFETSRKDQSKDINSIKLEMKSFQNDLKKLNMSVQKEVDNIKGPMTDLISDQQREKEILEESLKRQQLIFREILDEYSASVKTLMPEGLPSRLTTARPITRKSADSPKVTVKHKFFDTNNSYRATNPGIKTDENWLASYPDGKTLALPKVAIKLLKNNPPT